MRALLTLLALAGCGSPAAVGSGADLEVVWEGPERVSARRAGVEIPPLPWAEFQKRFAVLPLGDRRLAEVRLGPAWTSGDPALRDRVVQDLEKAVRAAGYLRVVCRDTAGFERDATPEADLKAVTARADEQEEQADLHVWAHGPEALEVRARGRAPIECALEDFLARAGSFTAERKVAVVVQGKAYSRLDEDLIFDTLLRAGFRKVAVQQAHSRYRPILRE